MAYQEKNDRFRELYLSGDCEQQRKSLMEMAVFYREMIDIENRLMNNRTLWFLNTNGFLFAALGIILAYYREEKSGLMISITALFALFGCFHALWIFKHEIDNGHHALAYLRAKWKAFLVTFYGFTDPVDLSRDFFIPPVIGLALDEKHDPRLSVDKLGRYRQPAFGTWASFEKTPLAYTLAVVWVLLFLIVLVYKFSTLMI